MRWITMVSNVLVAVLYALCMMVIIKEAAPKTSRPALKLPLKFVCDSSKGFVFSVEDTHEQLSKQNCTPGKTLYDDCNLCLCSEQSKWVGACMTDNCTYYGLGDEEILGAYKHDHQ